MGHWLVVLAMVGGALGAFGKTNAPVLGRSWASWKAACEKLTPNNQLQRPPPRESLPMQSYGELQGLVTNFLELSRSGPLSNRANWVGSVPAPAFFDPEKAHFNKSQPSAVAAFQPFAQVLNLTAGSEVYFRGDLHGDVRSLIANLDWLHKEKYLEGWTIVKTNFHMVFLGDYTDRGMYGIEVLYTLLRLKLANPERVFFLRGNHEELSLLARYGFFQEGAAKFEREFDPRKLVRSFDFLPVVLYVGANGNYLQCNHGGMEPGYWPGSLLENAGAVGFQLLGSLRQGEFLKKFPGWPGDRTSRQYAEQFLKDFVPEDPNMPSVLGFVWNDFTVLPGEAEFNIDPGRAFVFGQGAAKAILESAGNANKKVVGVFRAHQHSSQLTPVMRRLVASKGLYRHWQEKDSAAVLNGAPMALAKVLETEELREIPLHSVWTFNVGADSLYGAGCGFTFDTFGILQLAEKQSDWRIKVVNVDPNGSRN